MAEWLRRRTSKIKCFTRQGSKPTLDIIFFFFATKYLTHYIICFKGNYTKIYIIYKKNGLADCVSTRFNRQYNLLKGLKLRKRLTVWEMRTEDMTARCHLTTFVWCLRLQKVKLNIRYLGTWECFRS